MYALAAAILILAASVLVLAFVGYVRAEHRRNDEQVSQIFENMPDYGTPPNRKS